MNASVVIMAFNLTLRIKAIPRVRSTATFHYTAVTGNLEKIITTTHMHLKTSNYPTIPGETIKSQV